MAGDFSEGATPVINGTITLDSDMGLGGIATSGAHGRSFSLGVADSVTVLAKTAAMADALRAKMDRDFSPALITTVRGAGYMLEDEEAGR